MNTRVNLAGVLLKNPIMTASGTFGSGQEYSEFVDLNKLGAVVTKGVANVPWPGNPTPRVAEVYGGMLNAIGLQNPGIDVFVQRDIPFLTHYDTRIIVNVCGKTASDYIEVVERLAEQPVDMLEINISCPNVKEGGIAFGQDPKAVEAITKEMKKYAKQPVIMKLSPNVTDITVMAKAAEAGGAVLPHRAQGGPEAGFRPGWDDQIPLGAIRRQLHRNGADVLSPRQHGLHFLAGRLPHGLQILRVHAGRQGEGLNTVGNARSGAFHAA